MDEKKLILYIKEGCPWCEEVEQLLNQLHITYERIDVLRDKEAYQRMRMISGQSRAPTMEWGNEVLADFGGKELLEFIRSKNFLNQSNKNSA
ncbi:glutaredoxin family protein [Methylacidiphilum caldifontis]|uniref:NrdH-redoxin n=1 Tax=Methylacidiphilum caldifontis TaxID=2795386 RepID=A0A4Y8P9S4_9BACT|nr:glutaredoxin family protein [Methylacidiphilum caldifontis]QSR89093.1 glutaredoxin family protein [Methylacidiphilum caldifontis]TFE67435.1 NrdH-redoxin [Methylacidiphilum caldifontis]